MKPPTAPQVRIGQVWADKDPYSVGRTFRIIAIEDERAVCEVLTNSTSAQKLLDRLPPASWVRDVRGRKTRIQIRRLRPTVRGFDLIQDVAE